MKQWTLKELKALGYEIENATIQDADLSMADHGCLAISILIRGDGWGITYGGYAFGHGYLGSDHFDASGSGLVAIMRIMDTVGVERFSQLKGKYIRVAFSPEHRNGPLTIIGNITEDKWFDIDSFCKEDWE